MCVWREGRAPYIDIRDDARLNSSHENLSLGHSRGDELGRRAHGQSNSYHVRIGRTTHCYTLRSIVFKYLFTLSWSTEREEHVQQFGSL